jgi:hypothetical protein
MKDNKNIELTFGESKLLAKRFKTTPGNVRNILHRYRKGVNLRGDISSKIIRHILKNNTRQGA